MNLEVNKGNRKTWVYAVSTIVGLLVFVILTAASWNNEAALPLFSSWSMYQGGVTGLYMGANYGEHIQNRKTINENIS